MDKHPKESRMHLLSGGRSSIAISAQVGRSSIKLLIWYMGILQQNIPSGLQKQLLNMIIGEKGVRILDT